jgi:mediator of RNA polymerase II transcription subunit 14
MYFFTYSMAFVVHLVIILQTLIDTWSPLAAMGKLTVAPQTCVSASSVYAFFFCLIIVSLLFQSLLPNKKPHQVSLGCLFLPQSSRHIRLSFRAVFALDLHLRSSRTVGIRDGAYSVFDTSKVVEGLIPIPGLKAFLNVYVDEAAKLSQRRSTTEDDNPPSPMGMDAIDSFMSSAVPAPSPLPQRTDIKMVSSNPCTPASGSQVGVPITLLQSFSA